MDKKFQKIKKIVKTELHDLDSAHNIEHCMRVYNNCRLLAENKEIDLEVLQAAALLHDIGGAKEMNDPSGNTDHAVESAKMAKPILKDLGFSEEKIKHIQDCIVSHRYRTDNKPKTKEAEIVFDADKLETVGAIGIARFFVWVGKNNAHIYRKVNIDDYAKENLGGNINGKIRDKTKHSPQIDWETKDKYIVNCLYTDKARQVAKERTKFFKNFLDRLEKEINGKL